MSQRGARNGHSCCVRQAEVVADRKSPQIPLRKGGRRRDRCARATESEGAACQAVPSLRVARTATLVAMVAVAPPTSEILATLSAYGLAASAQRIALNACEQADGAVQPLVTCGRSRISSAPRGHGSELAAAASLPHKRPSNPCPPGGRVRAFAGLSAAGGISSEQLEHVVSANPFSDWARRCRIPGCTLTT